MSDIAIRRRRPRPDDEGFAALFFFGLLSAASFAVGWFAQGLGGF